MSASVPTLSSALTGDVAGMALEVMKAADVRRLRIATAESCTGGLLAALLTDIGAHSHVFDRGFVSYTDEAKSEMLGVDLDLIARRGAVSAEVAEAMALGALGASRADVAVSITGYADNGGDGEPGLVFFGVAQHGHRACVVQRHFGDIGRGAVRIGCLWTGLLMIGSQLFRVERR